MTDLKFKAIPSEIVTSASTGTTLVRGTSANLPYNQSLLKRLQAIVADSSYDGNFFDDDVLQAPSLEDLQKLLTQVIIRFDNDPNYYTKRDYYHLIWYLCQSLVFLIEGGVVSKSELDGIRALIEQLNIRIDGVDEHVTTLAGYIYTELPAKFESLQTKISELEGLLLEKQDKLEAGSGIKIEDKTISSIYTGESFKTSVKVGVLEAGSDIQTGDDIVDILKSILTKVIDVKRTNPTATITISPAEAELGTLGLVVAGQVTLKDGYYDPAEEGTNMKRQYMGCILEVPTTEQLGDFADATSITDQRVALAATIDVLSDVKLDTTISAHSTNNGCKSDGEISEQNQTEFTFDLSKTVRAFRNVYIGSISLVDLSSEEALAAIQNVSKGDLIPIAKTFGDKQILISSMQTVAPSMAVILACPSDYKLTSVIDGDSPFETVGQYIEYSTVLACGGTHTESYKLYVNPIQKTTVNLNIASIKFEKEA